MCPGGEKKALDSVMPLLRQVAAKDAQGHPCVGYAGTGGSGHYVKMIHNGIEHGMMSAVAEAWQIMDMGLGMNYNEIADEFTRWNRDGDLVSTPFSPRLLVLQRTLSPKPSNLHPEYYVAIHSSSGC